MDGVLHPSLMYGQTKQKKMRIVYLVASLECLIVLLAHIETASEVLSLTMLQQSPAGLGPVTLGAGAGWREQE